MKNIFKNIVNKNYQFYLHFNNEPNPNQYFGARRGTQKNYFNNIFYTELKLKINN